MQENIKFIVTGNSYDIFNNSFKHDDLNIFTAYNKKMFKKKISKIRIKKDKDNLNLKTDSIRLVQIDNYEILNNQLKKENKKLKVQRNIFGLTGLSFGLAFIFTMLFK